MRISDWSSDVCSSDLRPGFSLALATLPAGQDPDDIVRARGATGFTALLDEAQPLVARLWAPEVAAGPLATPAERAARPEERRVGKECVSTGRTRESTVH